MPEFDAHVLVCTTVTGDGNHCGDKGGPEMREKFNELLMEHGLLGKVNISNTGCTSQHRFCESSQGTVVVYGPGAEIGGTWYIATVDDVEEIVTEHLGKGNRVERIVNDRIGVNMG